MKFSICAVLALASFAAADNCHIDDISGIKNSVVGLDDRLSSFNGSTGAALSVVNDLRKISQQVLAIKASKFLRFGSRAPDCTDEEQEQSIQAGLDLSAAVGSIVDRAIGMKDVIDSKMPSPVRASGISLLEKMDKALPMAGKYVVNDAALGDQNQRQGNVDKIRAHLTRLLDAYKE